MNCQDFDKLIVNLACDVPMNADERANALAHAETCLQCGARLARQQNVAAALQALNKREQSIHAPERIGEQLMAAFAEQHSPSVRVVPAPKSFWAGLRFNWAMAATATALVLFALTAMLWWRTPAPVQEAKQNNIQNVNALPEQREMVRKETASVPPKKESVMRVAARTPVRPHVRRPSQPMQSEDRFNGFVALRPNADTEPAEFEQVVRMQIPRTTLALWGVRLSEDNDNQKVNAEVVFGEDGIARAIRILNNAERSNQ